VARLRGRKASRGHGGAVYRCAATGAGYCDVLFSLHLTPLPSRLAPRARIRVLFPPHLAVTGMLAGCWACAPACAASFAATRMARAMAGR